MDDQWLGNLEQTYSLQTTALIVPTRSLANELNERIALARTRQGQTVWAAPNILVWSDYVRLVWQHNRDLLKANTLISSSQASLLWTRIIEATRRQEDELALLNVQQTVRAVQRSWKLMHEWRVDAEQLALDHVADTEQFIAWARAYTALLDKRYLVDESLLLSALSDSALDYPFQQLVFVSYDLVNAAQQKHIEAARTNGIDVEHHQPHVPSRSEHYYCYPDAAAEIKAALIHARRTLEQNPDHRLSLIIPDLQHRQNQVQELARDVFYASESPLDVLNNNSVYRLSLGKPLTELAPIEAALSVIGLLKNKTTMLDLGFVLRSRYLNLCAQYAPETRIFETWLARQRIHSVMLDQLPSLYQQCLEHGSQRDQGADQTPESSPLFGHLQSLVERRQAVQQSLRDAKSTSDYSALSFVEWARVLSDWLTAWGWRTQVDDAQMNSLEYQLLNRWNGVLEEFASLASVQTRVGLTRALELLRQLTQNTVFLPKGVAAPLVISGLFEASGREVDTCILTGMHQDYPSPPRHDAFIANRFLVKVGHPNANAESSFEHTKSVLDNLLACSAHRIISYASTNETNREISMQVSPLFRSHVFVAAEPSSNAIANKRALEPYVDIQGPAWLEPGRAKGGSRIFENQSNCAFKAFVTHQLGFYRDDEAEFGLDGLDRGNIVHHLLDRLWQVLQTQENLLSLDIDARRELLRDLVERTINDGSLRLSNEKLSLLGHERARLENLLFDWLDVESQRPTSFSVVEREEQREGEFGGISYRYIIDRVDLTADGRSVIIDYKTGAVNRNDWLGERLKSPQMPLYALALDKQKHTPTSGVAYASLKPGEAKFIELSETGIFRKESTASKKVADKWVQSRAGWPVIFTRLAEDFLAGYAAVNPIDKTTCQYCELHAVCRVSQLRDYSKTGHANLNPASAQPATTQTAPTESGREPL